MLIANLVFMLLLAWALLAVYRKQQRHQSLVREQLARMQQFHSLTSDSQISLEEQIGQLLAAGCEMLDADVALVLEIDEDAGVGEVKYVRSCHDRDPGIKNSTIHVNDTTCQEAYRNDETVQFTHPQNANTDFQRIFETRENVTHMLGTRLTVNNQPYGSLCFYSFATRTQAYSELDRELVRMISSWLRVLQERLLAQQQMQQAQNSAEAASQAKSYFLANMSHEIRTPLATILGYSEALAESEGLSPENREIITAINTAGGHLQAVLNDVLDLSKIEAGQLLIENIPTSPWQIVQQVRSLMLPAVNKKALRFDIDINYPLPKRINTDPTRLKQILLNLCNNAVKFTEQGGITLRVRYLQPMQQLQFSVIDTGIGMDEEELSRILKPFSQADASISRKYGGTGLGLYISQQLVSQLGGHMSFTSKKDQGTEMDFTIAVQTDALELIHNEQQEADEGEEKTAPNVAGSNARVLLVEDNELNHELFRFHLSKLGLTTEFAVNGLEAVNILKQHSYDIVLMDTNMPVMDGETAIRELRKNGYKKPIISLTANAMEEDRQRCLQAGADEYLTKPLDVARFNNVIQAYLPEDEKVEQQSFLNDPKFRRLVEKFVQHLPEKIQQLEDALQAQDWQTVQEVSHNLKGLGGGYGMHAITDAAKTLNDAMKAGQTDDAARLLHALRQVCEQAIAEFNAT